MHPPLLSVPKTNAPQSVRASHADLQHSGLLQVLSRSGPLKPVRSKLDEKAAPGVTSYESAVSADVGSSPHALVARHHKLEFCRNALQQVMGLRSPENLLAVTWTNMVCPGDWPGSKSLVSAGLREQQVWHELKVPNIQTSHCGVLSQSDLQQTSSLQKPFKPPLFDRISSGVYLELSRGM